MSNQNLRTITNSFLDVHLISLASWRQASQISPRDHGGPYVVLQQGYDPGDMKMIPDEFVLGRSGQWLALGHFFKLPVEDRRAEFVFGTAGEVMKLMHDLPSKVVMLGAPVETEATPATPEPDEMAAAFRAGRSKSPGAGN